MRAFPKMLSQRSLLLIAPAVVASVAVVVASWGCTAKPSYSCTSNLQCLSDDGTQGQCETNSACSFPVSINTCASGRNFADGRGCVAASTGKGCIGTLVAGADHFCALKMDGTIWCWGKGTDGELGNGAAADSAKPVQVLPPPGQSPMFVSVFAGETFTCAINADGNVFCWGANDQSQLGADPADHIGPSSSTAVQVKYQRPLVEPDGGTVFSAFTAFRSNQLGVGGAHVCGINATDDRVYCWGENKLRQAQPDNKIGDPVPNPALVSALPAKGVSNICVGDTFSAAIASGQVLVWGDNGVGEFGNGTTASSTDQAPIGTTTGLNSALQLACGDEHLCVEKTDGALFCWGGNDFGQLGNGNKLQQTMVQRVDLQGGVGKVFVGTDSTTSCAVDAHGASLYCWGNNAVGQVGIGDNVNDALLQPAIVPLITPDQVAIGLHGVCATTIDGQLWCWGANDHGQLGNGVFGGTQPSPVRENLLCAPSSPP